MRSGTRPEAPARRRAVDEPRPAPQVVRAPAVGPPLAGPGARRSPPAAGDGAGRRCRSGWSSSPSSLAGQGRRGRRHQTFSATPGPRGRRRPRSASAAAVDLAASEPRPGAGRGARRRRPGSRPDGRRIEVERAPGDRCRRHRRPAARPGRRRRGVPRLRAGPAGLPRVQTSAPHRHRRAARGGPVVSALPEHLAARVDHVEVETIDQITLVLRDDRDRRCGGVRSESEQQGGGARGAAGRPEARAYDVSVPGPADHVATDPDVNASQVAAASRCVADDSRPPDAYCLSASRG